MSESVGSTDAADASEIRNLGINTVYTTLTSSLTLRVAFVAGLALIMLIPVLFLTVTVNERGSRYRSMLYDIASSWGHEQMMQGPVMQVPYTKTIRFTETVTMATGLQREIEKTRKKELKLYILPAMLNMDVQLDTESRQRGIFNSLVYRASVKLTAEFSSLSPADLPRDVDAIHWERAIVAFGLTDARAVDDVRSINWNGAASKLSPGHSVESLNSGFHLKVLDLDPFKAQSLDMEISVRGSGSFMFTPFGEITTVSVNSKWPHPSFIGQVLPAQREVSENGFSANYTIPHLARTFSQIWTSENAQVNLTELTAGVRIFEPVSLYLQIQRSVKYGILFIGLTFLLMLVFEQAVATRMHAVQYILVGFALALFYLVLLSLSEHIAFLKAYLVSAANIIIIISVYVGVVLRSKLRGAQMCFLMAFLYSVLYTLLQLEDYALLLGTALLVAVLVSLMIVTKNLAKRTINLETQQ